jgi:uncharacterized membrane protein YfbV (UPF0208 family)
MTALIALVISALFLAGLYYVNRRLMGPTKPTSTALWPELQRIEQLEREAKDKIRRQRQYAEDQLRRLSKWL